MSALIDLDSSPSPDSGDGDSGRLTMTSTPNSSTSTLPAFNGDTFTRPKRKERKSLYFMTGEDFGNGNGKPEDEPSAASSSSSASGEGSRKTGKPSVPNLLLEGKMLEKEALSSPQSTQGSSGSSNNPNTPKTPASDDLLGISFSEENFECVGEGNESQSQSFISFQEDTSLNNNELRDLNDSEILLNSNGEESPNKRGSLSRNGWNRSSLRRTTPQSGENANANGNGLGRRWGSFRTSGKRTLPAPSSSASLANHLYRSSSYHSSGRSSTGDPEEMYSDSSLEGEVIDLTKKVHHLEEKFTVLAENQNDVDDRYTRQKAENAELKTKLFMLEEQLRDVESRAEDKVKEEQRRQKDVIARMEREKQLQLENLEIKLQMSEKELSSSKIEVKKLEGAVERQRNESNSLADRCSHLDNELSQLRDHNRDLLAQNRIEREDSVALVELKRQLESLSQFHMNGGNHAHNHQHDHSIRRTDSTDEAELRSRLREAEEHIKRLKEENKRLQETNDELSAEILNKGLEDGRNLLKNTTVSTPSEGHSLAAEFEAMSNDEMRTALKDQKESNMALRAYIDNILLNIVEHYPQLLEVKHHKQQNRETEKIAPSPQ